MKSRSEDNIINYTDNYVMIDRKVVSSQDLLIITFYQAQLKLYDRSLGHLFLTPATAHMTAIKISTVNNV